MDPALEGLLKGCKNDQGMQREVKTWSKADGVYPLHLRHSIPLKLCPMSKE
jgi:hypothetical protein